MLQDLLKNLIVSASLGGLIGLQRQWDDQHFHPERRNIAGLRTFTLWAALGTLCATVDLQRPLFYLAGFLVIAVFIAIFIHQKLETADEGFGLTTGLAGLITYLIGGLVVWDQWKIALVLAVSLIILLASKRRVRDVTQRFTPQDVKQALQFAAISGVILQLVPNREYGPFQAFNPHILWLMVVLVSGLGFCGYVAVRLLGEKGGIILTGVLGGMASSTATTLAMSRQSKSQPKLSSACALAIILACTIMLGRVAFITLAVEHSVFFKVLPGLALLALPGLGFAAWFWFSKNKDSATKKSPNFINPLGLKVALQFAVIYMVIVFIARAATQYYGNAGLYWASFISGLTDLDAITVSVSQMAGKGTITPDISANAIVLGCLANTILKGTMACVLGDAGLRKPIIMIFGSTLAVGSAYLLFI
ncbi:MAG: MgtC/SapB family protein [Methylacidiphilales bacterium]|nr:MgtC/SapB family protein [Candidatus Methylacidiphilales bacterium]